MFSAEISQEEINHLPPGQFAGEIFLVSDREGLSRAIEMLKHEKVLGFDTETRPAFKKGESHKVALLQLSSEQHAWLFRLNILGFPEELISILANPNIHKIGLALRDDIRALQKLRPFHPHGFTDLQQIVCDHGIKAMGLKKLAAIILGLKISKSQQVSNWETPLLTEAQKRYAATDAWICREIWYRLQTPQVEK